MGELTQLYRHYDGEGQLLYVGISLSAVARLSAHKSRSGWYQDIARVEIENYESREEAEAAEVEAIQEERPLHNRSHNGYDSLIVDTFVRFARNTNGFVRQPVMRLCGEMFELPSVLIDDIKQRFVEVVDRRGEDWVADEAGRENIELRVENGNQNP